MKFGGRKVAGLRVGRLSGRRENEAGQVGGNEYLT